MVSTEYFLVDKLGIKSCIVDAAALYQMPLAPKRRQVYFKLGTAIMLDLQKQGWIIIGRL